MTLMLLIQYYLYEVLGLIALVIELWAFLDCVRRKPADFERGFKRTKGFWLGLTGGSAAVGALAVALPQPLSLLLFQLAAIIAACVYLADVKPAVGTSGRGSGSNRGPYGSW